MTDNARERLRADTMRDYEAPNPGLASRVFSLRAPERHDRPDPHRALQLVAVALTLALVATLWVVGRHIAWPGVPGAPSGPLRPPASGLTIRDADFISADVGWVVTARKTNLNQVEVFKTTDGGYHWTRQLMLPSGVNPLGIEFWPDGHGRIEWETTGAVPTPTPTAGSGSGPTAPETRSFTPEVAMETTTDGGASWSGVDETAPGSLAALLGQGENRLLTPAEGWKIGDVFPSNIAVLLHTTDGGRNWQQIADLTSLHRGVGNQVTFLDSATGWLSTAQPGDGCPCLYMTADGGRSWSPESLPLPADAAAGSVSVGEPVMFPGGRGLLPVDITDPPGPSPAPGKPASSPTPLLTPAHYVLVSSDGGRTWGGLTRAPFTSGNLASQVFLTPSRWVYADGQTIYLTQDAGRTWSSRQVFANGFSLRLGQEQRIDGSTIVAVADNSVVTRSGPSTGGLFRSLDGGKTWTALPLPPA